MLRIAAWIILCATSMGTAADWKLVWSDEFDRPGLPDPAKWSHEVGFIRNHELQFYTKDRKKNCRVRDGMLIIQARKEKFKNPDYDPSSPEWQKSRKHAEYTSACLITRGKGEWTYGRVEVRAKLPTGKGTWPAAWMLGNDFGEIPWPDCGEIDIMENVGYDPDTVHANIHTKAYNHVLRTNKGAKLFLPKPWDAFHVYAVEWFPDHMEFFVDDVKYFSFANEGRGNDTWPYDKPYYLILNFAVGGDWGGAKGVDPKIFPQQYVIDYVRVYQR